MKHANVRTLVLIIATFAYLFFGAAIFDHLESENEVEESKKLLAVEMNFKRRYNVSDADYRNITYTILRFKPYKAGVQWKFTGALYFATTVFTTIGYGHSTPRTNPGKIFCMFYAIGGIPLGLIMFQSIGERVNTFIMFSISKINCCFCLAFFRKTKRKRSSLNVVRFLRMFRRHSKPPNEIFDAINLNRKMSKMNHTIIIFISISLCLFLVTMGGFTFSHFEGWSYIDSCYYCLVTLTTIGFGDFVALQKDGMMQTSVGYYIFSLVFILFGLTVVSSAMNLLVLRFITTSNEADSKRSRVIGSKRHTKSHEIRSRVLKVNRRSRQQSMVNKNYFQLTQRANSSQEPTNVSIINSGVNSLSKVLSYSLENASLKSSSSSPLPSQRPSIIPNIKHDFVDNTFFNTSKYSQIIPASNESSFLLTPKTHVKRDSLKWKKVHKKRRK